MGGLKLNINNSLNTCMFKMVAVTLMRQFAKLNLLLISYEYTKDVQMNVKYRSKLSTCIA